MQNHKLYVVFVCVCCGCYYVWFRQRSEHDGLCLCGCQSITCYLSNTIFDYSLYIRCKLISRAGFIRLNSMFQTQSISPPVISRIACTHQPLEHITKLNRNPNDIALSNVIFWPDILQLQHTTVSNRREDVATVLSFENLIKYIIKTHECHIINSLFFISRARTRNFEFVFHRVC